MFEVVAPEPLPGSVEHHALRARIAKVRLAKALKSRGLSLDQVDWATIDAPQAHAAERQIGGVRPEALNQDGSARLHGHLTEDEFDQVLESKDSWDQRKSG